MNILLRYQPVYQMPDAPTSPAPSGDSGAGTTSAPPTPSSSAPSAPSPTTPETTATPPTDGGADSSFDFMFSGVNEDPLDAFGLPATEPTTPEAPVVQPAPAKPEPAVQPTTTTPAAPSPAPAPTEVTSPAPAPSLDPYDPGALAQHLATNEEQAVQYAADNLFKLSPKDVEALETNVVEAIPQLLAKTFVAAQRNFLMQMSQLIPTMIQRQGDVTKAHSEAVDEFYTRWPDLKTVKDQQVDDGGRKVKVGDLVMQYASVFRRMYPNASRQEAIERVGPMVMMAAKVVPNVAPSALAGRPSPMAPTGASGRPPQPSPFVPAGPSAGGASQVTAPQMSAVEAMFAPENE